MITADQLRVIMPQAGPRVDTFLEPINATLEEFAIDTPARVAAFLAQLGHESGQLRYTEELASGHAYDGRADLGNTRPEAIEIAKRHDSTPGPWWKGHGLIQVTGYDNHLACGDYLNLDLLNFPEQIAKPPGASRSAGWFWAIHKLNILADAGDFEKITKRINGGLNGYDERCELWGRARAVLA